MEWFSCFSSIFVYQFDRPVSRETRDVSIFAVQPLCQTWRSQKSLDDHSYRATLRKSLICILECKNCRKISRVRIFKFCECTRLKMHHFPTKLTNFIRFLLVNRGMFLQTFVYYASLCLLFFLQKYITNIKSSDAPCWRRKTNVNKLRIKKNIQ